MTNFNLERTVVHRRPTPWWVYIAGVLVTGLIIFAVVKALPGKKQPATADNSETSIAPEAPASSIPDVNSLPPPAPAAPAIVEKPAPAPAPAPTTAAKPPTVTTPAPPPIKPATTFVPPTPPPAAAPVSSGPASTALAGARDAQASGDLIKARELALAVWKGTDDTALKSEAESILNIVGIELVMTPRTMPEKIEYTVQPGDSLEKIAKKHGTTVELLRAGNNIKGSVIRAGDRMRIFTGKFSVSVDKSDNELVLWMNNDFFKRYRVGTGEFNKTPVGDFVINDRIAQPTWWRPDGKAIPFGDKENLLGTHWLSINVKGYGLHGTWEPETIGHQLSAGCVRMLNSDIEQLFTLLTLGTPVSIRD